MKRPSVSSVVGRRSSAGKACVICGCTQKKPCVVMWGGRPRPCSWLEEDLCDHPQCIQLAATNGGLWEGQHILERAAAHLVQSRGRFRGMNEGEGCPEFEFGDDAAWLPWMLLKAKAREVRLLHSESIAVAVAIRRETVRRARRRSA